MSSDHSLPTEPNLLFALHLLLSERSVSRAAARLSVSQSAMSHKLRALREVFNDSLLVRGGDGMVLTDTARALQSTLHQAFSSLSEGIRFALHFDPTRDARTFTLAVRDYAKSIIVARLGPLLQARAPAVTIEMTMLPPSSELPVFLERGNADIALVGPAVAPSSLLRVRLPAERFVVLARADHPRIRGQLSLDQYLAESHVLVAPGGGRTGIVDSVLQPLGLERKIAIVTRHFLVAPLLIARTDLIGTVPHRLAWDVGSQLRLQCLKAPLELPELPAHMLWHERTHKSPGHQWLRQLVIDSVSELDREVTADSVISG
ncbi:MAG: LysR family transcriptional regulator [Myxococcota bacterium]